MCLPSDFGLVAAASEPGVCFGGSQGAVDGLETVLQPLLKQDYGELSEKVGMCAVELAMGVSMGKSSSSYSFNQLEL